MPTNLLAGFFKDRKCLSYKKHEIILRADAPLPGVFYLQEGYVRCFSISKEGEELTLIVFKPGDFFPIQSILDTLDANTFEAMTPVQLFRVPKEEFLSFLKQNPDFLFTSLREIVTRLGGFVARMEHLVFGNAYERVASILFILAERFGQKQEKTIMIPMPISHRGIASFVGMTRETVSVEMKKLEKKGLIQSKGRFIYIKDMEQLQKESLVEMN